jgi:hypothetical protein
MSAFLLQCALVGIRSVRPLTSGGHDLDGEVDYRWIQRVGRSLLFKLSFFFFEGCSNFQLRRISVACLSWNFFYKSLSWNWPSSAVSCFSITEQSFKAVQAIQQRSQWALKMVLLLLA